MERPKVAAIVGPTAAGKSTIAFELARKLGGEVVSADSRQVYRFLDIGTAKPSKEERAAVPHHLLDVVPPDQPFDCARYRTLAQAAIGEILERGRKAIVVGGSGLYLKALTRGLWHGPPAQEELRAQLLQQEEREGRGTLHRLLALEDPTAARHLHPHDTVRIIRALEVFRVTGKPISQWQRDHAFRDRPYTLMVIGLRQERADLYRLIGERCRQMVRDGLVGEVQSLWDRGYRPHLPALRTIGYHHMGCYLLGGRTMAQAVEEMVRDTCHLAKRQLTWFGRDAGISWFHPQQHREIFRAVEDFFEDRPKIAIAPRLG